MLIAFLGSVEAGLIFGIMALGVYLTFRILDAPDLTADSSFATGGAVAAALIAGGTDPFSATAAAILAGCAAGVGTGVLHTKGKINMLLAGILSSIAWYSINLRIMGRANIPLLNTDTAFTLFPSAMLTLVVLAAAIKLLMDWFLHTEFGLSLRATGDNPRMIRSFSVNTDTAVIGGVAVSNGLIALAGGLWAQYQRFADISMGIGTIIVGLASVIIGEVIFGTRSIRVVTLAVIAGSILYRLVIAIALRVGLSPTDMKLVSAVLVIAALLLPRYASAWRKKRKAAAERRRGERACEYEYPGEVNGRA